MRKILSFLLLVIFASTAFTQNNVQIEQYMFNQVQFNPAYAVSANSLHVSFLHQSRWLGFEGAPNTQVAILHAPLQLGKAAIGGSLVHESIGVSDNLNFNLLYAYKLQFENSQLCLGVQAAYIQDTENYSDLTTAQSGDEQYLQDVGFRGFNAGFGVFWNNDNLYAGLSIPKLLENQMSISETKMTNSFNPLANPYFLTTGVVINAGDNFKLKPSLLVKHLMGSPLTIDLNFNVLIKNKFGIGAFYRFNSAFGMMCEYYITNSLRIAYAWHIASTQLISYNRGTHEVMLSYSLKSLSAKSYQSPRFF